MPYTRKRAFEGSSEGVNTCACSYSYAVANTKREVSMDHDCDGQRQLL